MQPQVALLYFSMKQTQISIVGAKVSKNLISEDIFNPVLLFSVAEIKYHDQKQLKEERSLLWFTVPGNRVHHDGGNCVSAQARSWLITFHPHTGSREWEQEGGLRPLSLTPSDILPLSRLHLLKFPWPPTVPWTEHQVSTINESVGDISHSNH